MDRLERQETRLLAEEEDMTTDNNELEKLWTDFVKHLTTVHQINASPFEYNQCGCVTRFQDESATQAANKAAEAAQAQLLREVMEHRFELLIPGVTTIDTGAGGGFHNTAFVVPLSILEAKLAELKEKQDE